MKQINEDQLLNSSLFSFLISSQSRQGFDFNSFLSQVFFHFHGFSGYSADLQLAKLLPPKQITKF